MSNTKKNKFKIKEEEPSSLEFCTECNGLEDFSTNDDTKEEEELKERFARCRKTGKFKGDVCARIFIADENETTGLWDEPSQTDLPEQL
jgi:hypothetical protein